MKNVRHEAKQVAEEAGEHPAARKDGLPKGAPRKPGMKSVFIRSGIAAAIFLLFLVYINHDTIVVALGWALGIGLLMIPLGMLLDRFTYNRALKRWMKQTGRA